MGDDVETTAIGWPSEHRSLKLVGDVADRDRFRRFPRSLSRLGISVDRSEFTVKEILTLEFMIKLWLRNRGTQVQNNPRSVPTVSDNCPVGT